MPDLAGTCARCGSALQGDSCQRCETASGVAIDDAKRKLEETRERLGAWRERLSKRLDEFQRKKDLLQAVEARIASRAPTARIVDEPLPPAIDDDPAGYISRAPNPDVDPFDANAATMATAPAPFPPLAVLPPPTSGADLEAAATDNVASPAVVASAPLTPPDRSDIPSDAGDVPEVGLVGSFARRAAALVLDILLLLVVPAAAVTMPAVWVGPTPGAARLWTEHATLLLPLSIGLFLLLVTLYLGSFGRTPGLRFTGLRVVDGAGGVPSYGESLLHALTLPLVLVPAFEGALRTRTVIET